MKEDAGQSIVRVESVEKAFDFGILKVYVYVHTIALAAADCLTREMTTSNADMDDKYWPLL